MSKRVTIDPVTRIEGHLRVDVGEAAVGAMEIVAIIDRRHRQEKSTQPA